MTNEEISFFYRFLKSKGIQSNFDYFYNRYRFGKMSLDEYLDDIEAEYAIISAFDMGALTNTIFNYTYWDKLHKQWIEKLSEYRKSNSREVVDVMMRCSHCGRMLPEDSFAMGKKGQRHKCCRECETGEWDRKRKELESLHRQSLEIEMTEKKLRGLNVDIEKYTKVCSHCGKRKLRSEFFSSNTTDDGLQSVCKRCQNEMENATKAIDNNFKKNQTNKTSKTMIENKNDDFTFFDFTGPSSSNRNLKEGQFAINNKKGNYRITMNITESRAIFGKGLEYLRLRKDNATGAIHMLFNRTTGLKCTGGNKGNLNVNSKDLVQFLINILGYKESDERVIVEISEDLSRTDDYATYLIKQK